MNCPLCTSEELQPVIRSGVEIDICPRCHGIWLDRGELDKVIDATKPTTLVPAVPADQFDPSLVADEGKPERSKDRRCLGPGSSVASSMRP